MTGVHLVVLQMKFLHIKEGNVLQGGVFFGVNQSPERTGIDMKHSLAVIFGNLSSFKTLRYEDQQIPRMLKKLSPVIHFLMPFP